MRALLSVSDKAGIVEFAQGLEKLGWEIISTDFKTSCALQFSVRKSEATKAQNIFETLYGVEIIPIN